MGLWDDFEIGKISERRNSATKVFKIKGEHDISQNDVSYWISHLILDLSGIIHKHTKEGIKLTKMINDGVPYKKILEYLNSIALSKISPKRLNELIEFEKIKAYEQGKDAKALQIREVLGVKDSY